MTLIFSRIGSTIVCQDEDGAFIAVPIKDVTFDTIGNKANFRIGTDNFNRIYNGVPFGNVTISGAIPASISDLRNKMGVLLLISAGGGAQNLQQVTDVGNTTTNAITIGQVLSIQYSSLLRNKIAYVPASGTIPGHLSVQGSGGNTILGIRESNGYVGVGFSFADTTTTNCPPYPFSVNGITNGATYMQAPVNNYGGSVLNLTDTNAGAAVSRTIIYARSRYMNPGETSFAMIFGRDNSLYNVAILGFGYAAANSVTNYVNLQFFSQPNANAWRWYASGNFVLGGTLADNGSKLDVNGNAKIGDAGAAVACSVLTINSETQGVLLPRMTTTQILAIVAPVDGLTVYNTTEKTICIYDGGAAAWKKCNLSNL